LGFRSSKIISKVVKLLLSHLAQLPEFVSVVFQILLCPLS